ncbi:MAG TPA: helix-turn-helix domain-containing protein [Pyrinomonadaceae bacterium]|jgi:transcriptional regulator with XRE-family HTH domain
MNEEFSARLAQAFDHAKMSDIARRIGVPHATIRNYFHGRLPAPEVLIKIASETNVSLNWLLMGVGDIFLGVPKHLDLGSILEMKIGEIVDRRVAGKPASSRALEMDDTEAADDFDVIDAVTNVDDPQKIMSKWFRHEGRKYPQDYGVAFFSGWESYTDDEKVEAIRDAKKVLDRTLRKKRS